MCGAFRPILTYRLMVFIGMILIAGFDCSFRNIVLRGWQRTIRGPFRREHPGQKKFPEKGFLAGFGCSG